MMMMTNCTFDNRLSSWVAVAAWEQVAICIIGSLCNAVGMWCLVGCQRTGKAVKVQLISILSLQMAISLVTLPFVTYLYYTRFFCWDETVPKQVQFFFSIFNSMLLQGERLNFTAMAVFRVIAVCSPSQYQKMVTTKMVASLQVGILLTIVPPWVALGITQDFKFSSTSGTVMRLHFEREGAFVMALYGIYYCLPFVVTFLAYTVMMLTMIRQNRLVKIRSRKRTLNMDHVAFTIRIVILTNLLLDGPHVVVHLLHDVELASIITHMAFFLHLVLDPVIFVGMNRNYREAVTGRMKRWLPLSPGSMGSWSPRELGEEHKVVAIAGEGVEERGIRDTWRQAKLSNSDKRHAVYVT